ncbi:helix-turn-helix transcriptional regulator [Paenibacillus mesophilus]|uniref:AraC family transcriptional regulator n=1 Tax=Paenibacillus mesophilus TaxID=2582849 RepID=UPI00110EFB27|nr:AraC family transcriptional regulator [Paenibacillus mesophilus]TMV45959.1 helix-turn-helix transcriptional regulator [Paenibacillus mesophilus]
MERRIRFNGKSLFAKLLLGFMIVIFISFAFNVIAYQFFFSQMRDQLIRSNSISVSKTVDGYEKQLSQLDDLLTRYYFDNSVTALKKGNIDSDFPIVNELADEFKSIVGNYNLDLENVFIYFKEQNFVIDKNGYTRAEDMFSKYYVSREYGSDFWAKQFTEDFHFRAFPSSEFRKYRIDFVSPDKGRYFPIIIRSQIGSQFYIGAFVDTDRMFAALKQASDNPFYMMDREGQLFFSTGSRPSQLPELTPDRAYALHANNYFFYEKGSLSGLTYVSVIPYQSVASQLMKMNVLLLALFAVSILVSIAISVLLSVRFKNPVQRIVESLRQMNPAIRHSSKIHEFNVISEGLEHIIESVHRKNSLLQKYGYLDKIKSIHADDTEMQSLIETKRPFHFIMFHIHYTREYELLSNEHPLKATYFLEFINLNVTQSFPDSMTMQIEKDRILSIVFTDTDVSDEISGKLRYFKRVFDQDKAYYQLTIACQPRLWEPSEFTSAYEAAGEMVRSRKLDDATQIVEASGAAEPLILWTSEEERSFAAMLEAGNEAQLLTLARGSLHRLAKSEAAALHYRQFASDVVSKVLMALMAHKIDTHALYTKGTPFDEIERLVSVEQYAAFFERLLGQASALIRDKREARDPIVDFVVRFIEERYGDDIYQDLIADRLNISTGYLRNYFKEKTGQNLSDYLNEYRIEKAKAMLEETEEKIQDIAAKVGYQNANSFTRMFRRLTGITPGEYRRDKILNPQK